MVHSVDNVDNFELSTGAAYYVDIYEVKYFMKKIMLCS